MSKGLTSTLFLRGRQLKDELEDSPAAFTKELWLTSSTFEQKVIKHFESTKVISKRFNRVPFGAQDTLNRSVLSLEYSLRGYPGIEVLVMDKNSPQCSIELDSIEGPAQYFASYLVK